MHAAEGSKPDVRHAFTKRTCLDSIEAAHRDTVYPVVFCHATLEGLFDVQRLEAAVSKTARFVPEVLYAYEYPTGRFVDRGYTATRALVMESENLGEGWRWDFSTEPQIKISVVTESNTTKLTIAMSHLLSDGRGLIQYLYLLCALYNGHCANWTVNIRDVGRLAHSIRPGRPTVNERLGARLKTSPLLDEEQDDGYRCLTTTIGSGDLAALKAKAKSRRATLNDAFLTGYARIVAREGAGAGSRVTLPCPVDLRQFAPGRDEEIAAPDALSIANLTGMYTVSIDANPSEPFERTLAFVHDEMLLQKERYRCFSGISLLHGLSSWMPARLIDWLGHTIYSIMSVSYTNLGIIDADLFSFEGCTVKRCFMTGTYRPAPGFQLSVSTFDNACTLNACIIGTQQHMTRCQALLDDIKRELMDWSSKAEERRSATLEPQRQGELRP